MRKFRMKLWDGTDVRIGDEADLARQTLALGYEHLDLEAKLDIELDELRKRLAVLEARS